MTEQVDVKLDAAMERRILDLYTEGGIRSASLRRRLGFLWTVTRWVFVTRLKHGAKRVFDLAVGVVALALTSPIMAATAILVKLDSPGPVFFKQTRVGKWGVTFQCFKFRSMYVDAEARKAELLALNEADGPVFKMKDDPRITRVGRVIRKLSIDELPQLLNVIKGEMSLVGPRPPVPKEVAEYTYDQRGRLDAVPGVTGLQQVSGRSDLDFEQWVAFDKEYIRKQSFWYDLQILFKTVPAVLLGKGAY